MLPLIVFDYCVVKGASDETLAAVLVARLYPSRALFACVCDKKGPDEYATFKLGIFLKESGYQKCVYKTGQEGSIQTMIDEALRQSKAGEASDDPTMLQTTENSAVGASASNGRAERAVQTFAYIC